MSTETAAISLTDDGTVESRFRRLVDDGDLFFRNIAPPSRSNVHFQVDGVPFNASHSDNKDGIKLTIWATFGPLPFSAESVEKRRTLIAVMDSTRHLKAVKFGVDERNMMMAKAEFQVSDIEPPDFIFVSLIRFIQEARPYIRLIGECI